MLLSNIKNGECKETIELAMAEIRIENIDKEFNKQLIRDELPNKLDGLSWIDDEELVGIYNGYTIHIQDNNTITIDGEANNLPVTGIELNLSKITMGKADKDLSRQLVASIFPEYVTNKSIIWTSSDPSVATVDENGLVTAISAGNAIITAQVQGSEITSTCTITVTDGKLLYVLPNGSTNVNDLTSYYCFSSIEEAVDFAVDGDTICFTEGIYNLSQIYNDSTSHVGISDKR